MCQNGAIAQLESMFVMLVDKMRSRKSSVSVMDRFKLTSAVGPSGPKETRSRAPNMKFLMQ